VQPQCSMRRILTLLTRVQIEDALRRLGELALQHGDPIELLAVGGAVMVLAYDARLSTHDVDAISLQPESARFVRGLVRQVAEEFGWPSDWLNDGAKGFLIGLSDGGVIYAAPGIVVHCPMPAQLLAMKLSAWRDDVDIQDATRLLQILSSGREHDQEALWSTIEPFITPGQQLKARYAFLDIWESLYDND
jgi:hypothetical protein